MLTDSELTERIIGAAIEAHRELGPGLLESTYEACLQRELTLRGIECRRQVVVPIVYKGLEIDEAYRIDLLVEERIIVELKSVEEVEPIHKAQVITYLKLAQKETGLLLNFNSVMMKDGITRLYRNAK